MSQTKYNLPYIYNPGNQPKEELIENYVIRLKEFQELFLKIKIEKIDTPPQHVLIQGQRGYGKTTLLRRLFYEIENDRDLSSWLIPVIFDEEQYFINELAKLWMKIAEYLESYSEGFDGISDQIEDAFDQPDYEENSYKILLSFLKKNNKKLILFIDNFNEFISKLKPKDKQRLREIFITSTAFRLIAASAQITELTFKFNVPFYEFFKIIKLNELNKEETIALLEKLGETYKSEHIKSIIKNQPERIEALRRITSGVPRTIILLFEIFIDSEDGNSFKDLEMLLDRVSPLYKHRMDNLTVPQQTIVDAIAMNWDASSVKEIAKKTRIASKTVSAQLNLLEKNDIIRKIETSTKNNLYELKERFFNIWYLMRFGTSRDRKRVLWLVKFLEIWCSQEELVNRAKKHIDAIKQGKIYENCAFYFTEALSLTNIPSNLQHSMIKETRSYLESKKNLLSKELLKSHIEVYEEVKKDLEYDMPEKALKKLKEDGNSEADSFFILALYYEQLNYLKKAEEYYLKAVEKDDTEAMNNLALLYETELKDYKKAEEYFLKAVGKDNLDAIFNLASLYQIEIKDIKKAEKYYLKAVEKDDPEAMNNLGTLYEKEFKDFKNAEKYYLKAVNRDIPEAMNNLAVLYAIEFKDYKKAEEYFLKSIDRDIPEAMSNLGSLYEKEFKDYKKAEEYYLKAVEKGDSNAMDYLALLYETEFKDYKKAEEYFLKAVEKNNPKAMNNLAFMYFKIKNNKHKALELSEKANALDENVYTQFTYACILLWNNLIEEAIKIITNLFNANYIENNSKEVLIILMFLLSKKQYNYVLKIFNENLELKEKVKPIYYALMYLMRDKFPDEYKKMGEELKQTVDEILATVEKFAKDYE